MNPTYGWRVNPTYGWRELLRAARASGLRVGSPGPNHTWTGGHSKTGWHFRDSCYEGPQDGCAVDFGVGGADMDGLAAFFLRPHIARHIPEMILDHTYWSRGKGRNYAPHDHCGHRGNRHLHIGIDPCAHLPVAVPEPPPPADPYKTRGRTMVMTNA